jgi:hypothetical protein
MVATPHPSLLVSLGVVALIVWRMSSRVRRMVGRQVFSRARARATVILFPLLLILVLFGALAHPTSLLALAAGAGLGVALGFYGLRLTTFEEAPLGLFSPRALTSALPCVFSSLAVSAIALLSYTFPGNQRLHIPLSSAALLRW